MRKTLLSLSLTCISFLVYAQETTPFQSSSQSTQAKIIGNPVKQWSADLAMWNYYSEETIVPASWNMLYYDDNLFEVRHNFDQTNALSIYYGHRLKASLGSVDFSFTPAIGFTSYDGHSNVGLTSHTILQTDKWRFYTINQYNAASFPLTPHILYHWDDFGYHVTDWLVLGASDQYYETGNWSNMDAGPSVGVEIGSFYGKAYGWDAWSETDRYYGAWFGWYFSNED